MADIDKTITEYATEMSGGGMHIRYSDPEIERTNPLGEWIEQRQRRGIQVWRRRVIVMEDWVEVTEP